MKVVFLAVIASLVIGGLYVWVTTPSLPASTHPVPPFAPSSSGPVWWVGASSTDSSALPNTGVRGTIQVISTPVVGCLAFWVSDDLSNGVWGQVGYYICNSSTPVAFYEIWNLNSNAILTSGSASVSVGTHTFSMYLQSGTTWAYSLDGAVFGTYDMGASVSSSTYPVYALSEEEANSTFTLPAVTFSTALQVMKSDSWSPVQTAESYGTGWGVVGAKQSTELQANQITVGGSLAVLPQGTQLWSTGVASTTSSSTTSSSSSISTSSIATLPPVTSTVTSTATSTATSTVTSTATSTITTTTAKTTTSTVTSPTTVTSTVTATRISTGTVTSISTVASPSTTTTRTVTTTSTVTPPVITSTRTTTQAFPDTVTSTSTVTLAQTTTTAKQTMTTTDTQTVTSTLILNHTSTVTTALTVTSRTVSASIQPTTVTETTFSQVTTTATETVPSTATVTMTLSGTPAASTTCGNGTSPSSSPCSSTRDTSAALLPVEGGSVLAILIVSLTGLALVISRRIHS